MCTETGIKDVYWGVQGACPRRAVIHAGGMAERSERRAVGMGLKLVLHSLLKVLGKLEVSTQGPQHKLVLQDSILDFLHVTMEMRGMNH